jgi:hypothetical protein
VTLTTDSQQQIGAAEALHGSAYPDIADVSHTTAETAGFFWSYFTAKTGRDIEATHAHFHPDKTAYFDATLGWGWTTNTDLRKAWEQYMPGWTAEAKSYPTRILGDMTSAVVFMTNTPELFGGELAGFVEEEEVHALMGMRERVVRLQDRKVAVRCGDTVAPEAGGLYVS